jgi:hypothetical protein
VDGHAEVLALEKTVKAGTAFNITSGMWTIITSDD